MTPQQVFPVAAEQARYRLIDVRAPAEVARGAIPGAIHEPILNDEERHQVGLCYKQHGAEAATALGYEITASDMPRRVARWHSLTQDQPSAVMCWRGGMRSKLAAEFIGDPALLRVEGGYKALRHYLMNTLTQALSRKRPRVIAGLTGSGKTALLARLAKNDADRLVIDLEGEAGHRGSAFGALAEPQPAQASFENSLAVQLILSPHTALYLEDESRYIGARELIDPIMNAIIQSPVVLLEEPAPARAERIVHEYVWSLTETLGAQTTKTHFETSLHKIKKRLGGPAYRFCLAELEHTLQSGAWHQASAHHDWILTLLEHYYDPLYRKALDKQQRPVLFRGTLEECESWINQHPSD